MATVLARGTQKRQATRGFVTPLVYMATVAIIGVLLLPSALRPPPDEATTSAEFSPDAPPEDEAPESIISSLRQAGSAGAGSELTEAEQIAAEQEIAAPTTTIQTRAPRGQCFGDPPRQTDSFYSAGCAPGWVGDNGGATARGVTGDEYRVAWFIGESDRSPEGPVSDEPPSNEEDSHRHARVYQTYFNQRYEMYGRRMRIVLVKAPLTGEAEGRAAAARAEEFGAFAASTGSLVNAGALDELVRRKIVTWIATENPHDWLAKNHPYTFSFNMHSDKIIDFTGEMVCKQLAGKPPSLNGRRDRFMDYTKPRVFGFILYEDQTRYGSADQLNEELARCGEKIAITVKHNLYDNQSGSSGAITRLRAEGVTTVFIGGDSVTPVVFTNEAANSEYWPEWINMGAAGMHGNGAGQLYNQEQWTHSIGLFYPEMPRESIEQDYYRAYKSVEPGESPGGAGLFRELQMIANGVQGAGPKLTPETFWQGLQKMPRRPPDPVWSIGGAFGPNDYSYSDFISLAWWDPEAQDPREDLPGAYRWWQGGRRFGLGELPTEPVPWHDPTQGVVMAAEAEAYWAERGGGG